MQKLMTVLGLGLVALTSFQAGAADVKPEVDACSIRVPSEKRQEQVVFKIAGETMGSLEDKTVEVTTPVGAMTVRFSLFGSFSGEGELKLDTSLPRRIAVLVKGPEKNAQGELMLKSITSFGMPGTGSATVYGGGKAVYIECLNFKGQ